MRGLICLLLWQGLSRVLPPYLLPAPRDVAQVFLNDWALLLTHLGWTCAETLLGLLIGLPLGVALALSLALWPAWDRALRPILLISQAIPVFVLAPVLTLWLGYGLGPKLAMVALLVFFPVLSALDDGLRATPEPMLDLARVAGARRGATLRWLQWPYARPYLGAGLRIAVVYAPTGAVIGEWVGASRGLGYLMLMANARLQTPLMFAALALVVALVLGLWALAARLDL